MTSLRTLDQRLLDQRLSTMSSIGWMSSSLSSKPRYNTQIMAKFMRTFDPETKKNLQVTADFSKLDPAKNSSLRYGKYWDADMQSYMYLQDFLKTKPNWKDGFEKLDEDKRFYLDEKKLDDDIKQILELAPEREERFMEIIDQDDADGAASYWLGMLHASPARHPATFLMVRVGRRIGEHVVMCLKGFFRRPRPSQICPAIVPMIDPPATSSFPAGHALQAYLISYLLAYSLRNIPGQNLDDPKAPRGPLFSLADRVSENRIVAGLHFPTDIEGGKEAGRMCFDALKTVRSVWGEGESKDRLTKDGQFEQKSLRARVREEFPQYA